jgi:hypothetical protein
MFGEPVFALSQHARQGACAAAERMRRHLRVAHGHLGLLPFAPNRRRTVRGRRVHHGGLLVHGLDVVRKPSRDARHARWTDTFAGIRPATFLGSSCRRQWGPRWQRPLRVAGSRAGRVCIDRAARNGTRRCTRRTQTQVAPMITVLFACTHNAGRSQMASTFFNSMADPKMARAISAGDRARGPCTSRSGHSHARGRL